MFRDANNQSSPQAAVGFYLIDHINQVNLCPIQIWLQVRYWRFFCLIGLISLISFDCLQLVFEAVYTLCDGLEVDTVMTLDNSTAPRCLLGLFDQFPLFLS